MCTKKDWTISFEGQLWQIKKEDTFGNGLIAFLFICMIFLMGYAFKKSYIIIFYKSKVEINHEYDPKTNIQQVFYHSDSGVRVSSDIDTKRVGNYTVLSNKRL